MPFTAEEFFDVFRRYNSSVWPSQWVLALLAIAAATIAVVGSKRGSRAVSVILSLLWLWMGLIYHALFFTTINPAAVVFAVLFVGQGLLFGWYGGANADFRFVARRDAYGIVGALLMLFALVGYPLLSLALGHRYPEMPTFGLPCPTTIFTLGMLLWIDGRVPVRLAVIPLAWSALGMSAAVRLGAREDYSLLVAALTTATLMLAKNRSSEISGATARTRWKSPRAARGPVPQSHLFSKD